MARYKNDPALKGYDAGDTFNYAVWTANSELTLCNVPWDSSYKDVWGASDTNALNDYIDGIGDSTTITNAMYARIDEPIAIDMPLGRAQRYNYIRVFNPAQPVGVGEDLPKYYYYFIRGVRHVAPETTEIIVQLDVWQTYSRLVQFGRAYIERGHIGIANEHNFRNYGRDFLTVPEGLDTGSEYINVASVRETIMEPMTFAPDNVNGHFGKFNVMAISTVDLNGDFGTPEAPKAPSAKPVHQQGGLPSGAGVYFWDTATEFLAFLSDFSSFPWVTAGIVSITLIPERDRYLSIPGYVTDESEKNPVTKARQWYGAPRVRRDLFKSWRDSSDVIEYLPARYRHLKKFFTAPYCVIELTFGAGSAVVLKPESWNSSDASVLESISVAAPDIRVGFIPLNYNGRNATAPGGYRDWTRDGDYLDIGIYLSSFPTLPIVNNGQILALAQSARSIAAQYNSSDMSYQRALQGNRLAQSQADAAINASANLSNIGMSADQQQTGIQQNLAAQTALLNMIGGTASGAGMGAFAGPGGAIAGAAGGLVNGAMGMLSQGMQADAVNQSLGVRMSSGAASRDVNTGLGVMLRDSNRSLADSAAHGDYANARSAMDAKIQDMQTLPHAMSGQFGGETFNLVNNDMALTLKIKMVDQAAISVVGEYWLRYGYPVRRSAMIPNDLHVMSRFSYWKLLEVYLITAAMPEGYKQALRGILENGVTVWKNPLDIGRVDFADNVPLPGVVIDGYVPPHWEPEPEPEPPVTFKKRKRNMLVFATNDNGMKYALAGTSPGTEANFIITDSVSLSNQFLAACGVDEPVLVDTAKFYELQALYTGPVVTVLDVE